jgi:hypothetical protein
VCASVCVKELDEILLGATTLVWERVGGALGKIFDGGVGRNALILGESLGVLGLGVDLCDEDGGFGDEIGGEGFPDWGERLAVYIWLKLASYVFHTEI